MENTTIKVRDFENMKGIKPIHLFNEIWGVGRLTVPKNSNTYQRIIYSPLGKQYHLYGKEAKRLSSTYYDWDGEMGYNLKKVDPSSAKIHILTNILDDPSKWNFDLKKYPNNGDTIKIIYHNGTIEKLNFSFTFKEKKIKLKRTNQLKTVKPIAWRKCTN